MREKTVALAALGLIALTACSQESASSHENPDQHTDYAEETPPLIPEFPANTSITPSLPSLNIPAAPPSETATSVTPAPGNCDQNAISEPANPVDGIDASNEPYDPSKNHLDPQFPICINEPLIDIPTGVPAQ